MSSQPLEMKPSASLGSRDRLYRGGILGIERSNVSRSIRVFPSLLAKHDPDIEQAHRRFLELRYAYIHAMGWRPGATTDFDAYDNFSDTLNLISYNSNSTDEILVGMRLTPVVSMEHSISWSMLGNNKEMQYLVQNSILIGELREAERVGRLFDLTRVVTTLDDTVEASDLATGVLDLIGAGIVSTCRSPEEEKMSPTAWLFVTTDGFHQFLESVGISHDVLATGMISEGDESVSHVCVAYPQKALDLVRTSDSAQGQATFSRVDTAMKSLLA